MTPRGIKKDDGPAPNHWPALSAQVDRIVADLEKLRKQIFGR